MDAGWIVVIVLATFYVIPSIMILFSLMAIVWPKAAWYASEGWKFRGAEPSTMALVMTRISGFFGCIFGVVFLVVVTQFLPVKFGPGPPAAAPVQAPPAPAPK
jgi:hypothetical protein